NFDENTVSIDGTGDPTTMKVNYESKRAKQRKKKHGEVSPSEVQNHMPMQDKKHDFQYDVLSVGAHTKIIAGFSTADDHKIGELSHAPAVIEQTVQNVPNFAILLGDALYANRPFCRLVASCNAVLYSLPKSNANLRSHGVPEWKKMMYELILDPQGFLNVYHNRSISETANSMIKRREPIPIRKRLSWRKSMEEYVKVNIHNIRQSGYLVYLVPHAAKAPLRAVSFVPKPVRAATSLIARELGHRYENGRLVGRQIAALAIENLLPCSDKELPDCLENNGLLDVLGYKKKP
ncbi:ISA1214-6 transposase, partial [mine drainage metagenome]